jgi:hypothetical protein
MSNPIPELDRYSDQNERGLSDELDIRQAQRFTELHPEIYFSERNGSLLRGWIESRGGCISVRNLEIAARELLKQGALETRPVIPEPAPSEPTKYSPPKVRRVIPTQAEQQLHAEVVSRYADRPFENDVARKKRDEQLRRASIADRIAKRNAR